MKTLVTAKHEGGPFPNGHGGCCTRWVDGFCSGARTAAWLNSLGEDDEPYGTHPPMRGPDRHVITNGEVRLNWLRGAGGEVHIVSVDARKLELRQEIERAQYTAKAAGEALRKLMGAEK